MPATIWDEPTRAAPSLPDPHQRPTTDIKEWLSGNAPQDYAELQELRKALYARRTHGRFVVKEVGFTHAGEEKFTVTGRASSLLIVSNKSRHFLLRALCRMLRRP